VISVLHLNTERTWRGGERQTFWLARELHRRGLRSVVACRPGFPLEKACRGAGVPTVDVRPWGEWDVCAARRLRLFMTRENFRLLHAHTGHAVGLGALAVRKTGAKLLVTRRVDFPVRGNFPSRWKYGRADKIVAISEKVRDVLAAGGRPVEKIAVVPSGIDAAGYPSPSARAALRRERGLPAEAPLAVNVAALVPHKDQDNLLRAWVEVVKALPAAQCVIVGEGPLRETLARTAAGLGVADSVRFTGYRDDAAAFIAAADVYVMPSFEEGLGTSLIDALAIGVPTAATRAGGIPEIYGGAAAPELVPVRDPAALARNILSVLQHPEEARRRVERGRARAALFTVAAMADRYEEIYEELVG